MSHYHVSKPSQYEGQQVTVLGGGDSAVDWALAFDKIAPTTIIHRQDNFPCLGTLALKNSNNLLSASNTICS